MFDPDDSWESERKLERDHHREPIRVRRNRPLVASGTVRSRFEPDADVATGSYTDEALTILRNAGLL